MSTLVCTVENIRQIINPPACKIEYPERAELKANGEAILRDCLRSGRVAAELIKNKDPQSMRILESFQRFEEK